MSDYQSIVENIRNQISYFGSLPNEQVQALAESYVEAVQEVNARLLRCSQMIRSGNPSEAVRLAEIEPDLLESFALLDFPERLQWSELARSRGAAVPAPLFEELAREVNDAYTTVNPLQPLLKKHRFLAIARAPISQRIAVLRELVLMEPDNLEWKADLESYEKTRYRELEKDVQDAIATKDVDRMSALVRELDPKLWSSPPPEKYTVKLRQMLKSESQRALRTEIERLIEKLREAYETDDAPQGIKYADRWYRLTHELGENAVPLDWKIDVQAALLWVEEKRHEMQRHQDFEMQVQQFRTEIQSGANLERLDILFSQLEINAEELEQEIPEPILRLYESKRHTSEVRGTRHFRIFLIAVVLLGLMLTTGIVLGFRHFQQQEEIRQIAAVLQGYLDRKNFDAADQYLEEQKAKLELYGESPILVEVHSELKAAVTQEKERRILFRDSLNRARESLKSGTMDQQALLQAQSRAQSESEKFELLTLEREYSRVTAEAQNRIDFSLRQMLDPIILDMQPLQARKGREDENTLRQLGELRKKAVDSRKIEGASFNVQNDRERLIGQLEQWIGEINQRKESKGDITDLTKTVANPSEYAKTLQTLAGKYPNLAMAKDFTTLLSELPAWNQVEKWNKLVNILPGASLRRTESLEEECKKVDQFLAEWQKNSQEFTDFPEFAAVEYNLPYMRAKTKRFQDGHSLLTDMEKEFLGIQSRPLWLYRAEKTGERYYLVEPPKAGRNKYLADKRGTERAVQLTELAVASISAKGEAPQVRFAKLALKEFAKIKSSDGAAWRDAACTLLQHLQDDPDYDPLLKFVQLRELIKLFSEGDLSVEKAYSLHLSILEEEAPSEFVDWLDPRSEDAAEERKAAAAVLAKLPSSRSTVESVHKDAEGLKNHPISLYERIGWAEKTNEGTWTCTSNRSITREGLVILRGSETEEGKIAIRFESVGVLDADTKKIASSPGLLFGTPIYLKTTSPYSQRE